MAIDQATRILICARTFDMREELAEQVEVQAGSYLGYPSIASHVATRFQVWIL